MAADPWWDAECRAWERLERGIPQIFSVPTTGVHRGFMGKYHGKYGLITKWLNFMIMQYLLRVLVRISSLDYMGIDGVLITKILGTTINGGV